MWREMGRRVPGAKSRAFYHLLARGTGEVATDKRIQTTVYPRSRGEQNDRIIGTGVPNGLSPLARGTDYESVRYSESSRFIPARAGNRRRRATHSKKKPVYPRSRGEQLAVGVEEWHAFGLSPLARGTGGMSVRSSELKRFIPARAGNRVCVIFSRSPCPVYPRSRGEQG